MQCVKGMIMTDTIVMHKKSAYSSRISSLGHYETFTPPCNASCSDLSQYKLHEK